MCFDENPLTCQCEKEDEKAEGFQMSHFYWSFSSDIMAIKGLKCHFMQSHICKVYACLAFNLPPALLAE